MGTPCSKETLLTMAHSKQAIMALALKAATLYLRIKQEAYRRYSAVSLTTYEASQSASLVSITELALRISIMARRLND